MVELGTTGGNKIEDELKEREIKFSEQLNKISNELYSGILNKNMPLSRRVELVRMRWNAKAEAFTDWLSQEIHELKNISEKMQKKELSKLKHSKSIIKNEQGRLVSKNKLKFNIERRAKHIH